MSNLMITEHKAAVATILKAEIADCIRVARAQGWTGDDRAYELTEIDCASIIAALGRKPSREEWAETGYPYVGGTHVADED